jgi:menaquinol-cytochrome c reductase cytochrome b/c subunit
VGDSRVRKSKRDITPPDYSAYPGKSEAFVPNFLLKEWMVGAVVLVGYMALVIAHPSPLGYPADPNNTEFIPMPDWYFLFLYQLLKYPYVSGKFVLLGVLGVPGVAFGGLLLAPFLDRGKERRWYKRPVASSLMLLSIAAIVYLTNVSWTHYQHELEARGMVPEHILREIEMEKQKQSKESGKFDRTTLAIMEEDHEGYSIYQKATCVQCHGADLKGQAGGPPSLRGIGEVYTQEQIMDIIKNGKGGMSPQVDMNASMGVTEEQLKTLAEWLAMQKRPAENAGESTEAAPGA